MPLDFMQYGVLHITDEIFIQQVYLESKQDFIQNSSRSIGDKQRIKKNVLHLKVIQVSGPTKWVLAPKSVQNLWEMLSVEVVVSNNHPVQF